MSNDWGFISGVATFGVTRNRAEREAERALGEMLGEQVTVDVKPLNLSAAAVGALIDAGTSRIGAVVAGPRSGSAVLTELYAHGLIGPERGLTRAGSIRRDREVQRAIDEAF